MKLFLHWSVVLPIFSCFFYFLGFTENQSFISFIFGALFLISSVLSAVHHSEVVAHKVGEPFGTIILAVAITIIEVALIVSLMLVGGKGSAYLSRDTVFAAIMLILNGILGFCLLVGGIRHKEQYFSKSSVNTGLVSLMALIVLTLILPNYTTSIYGPRYSIPQLIFVAVACLVIYTSFLFIQTIRHRGYFLPDSDDDLDNDSEKPTLHKTLISLVLLIICLVIVVLLAKAISPTIEESVTNAGLPKSLVGVIIAAVVLLPEGIAAINAARRNRLQTSLNLAFGSALASIGLTVPSVVLVSMLFDLDVILGIDKKSMVLLGLSLITVMLSLSKGKTNILYGTVLIVNLVTYIFTTIFP